MDQSIEMSMKDFRFFFLIGLWLFLNMLAGILIKFLAIKSNAFSWVLLLGALLLASFFGRAVVSMCVGKYYQLSFAYPFLGINYILSVYVGNLLFHEQLSSQRIIGSLVIMGGVFILMKSKNQTEEKVK